MPVGLVLFGGTLVGVLRRKVGPSSARKGYPRVAEQLGLAYESPRSPGELGTMRGQFQGYAVTVLPEHSRIVVELPRPSLIDLRSYVHWKRKPEELESFSFGARWADLWMVSRFCDPALSEVIHDDPTWLELLQKVRPFQDRLKQLTIEGERLECVFDYGSPAHIPAGAVADVLPALVMLAKKCVLASDQAS